jgi:hypothetical protein
MSGNMGSEVARTVQVHWRAVGSGSASHAFIDGRYWMSLCGMGPATTSERSRRCVRCELELARVTPNNTGSGEAG